MSLIAALSGAKSEEDVKDAYIKAIGLKSFTKGRVDIQTENMWFEAKESPTAAIAMFAQLLFYVRQARTSGERIPAFLSVIDREKAAILETDLAFPILDDDTIDWPTSASQVSKKCITQVGAHIDGQFGTYQISLHEKEFLATIKSALTDGRIIRTPITPDNLRQVFDKWVEMVGREMVVPNEADYASLFFADIMHDGDKTAMTGLSARLLYDNGKPVFLLLGKTYELASLRGYRNFWRIYHRPPETRHRHYLLERRDSLLPLDEQKFKGAFYTPLHIVDKAYNLLGATLGVGWQDEYIIWDMCCGVGNLEVKHSNYRNIFMSTLDQADVDIMRASKICLGAEIFQYDYLNDDVTDFGEIDYRLSNKLPTALRQALADAKAGKKGAKKILVLINPPYAEATSSDNAASDGTNKSKTGVAVTRFGLTSMSSYGAAKNELFTQFVARIYKELPGSKLGMFSTLKYINSQALEQFRHQWKSRFLDGFVVHSVAFDSLKGDFPIGFLVWDTNIKDKIGTIEVDALDKGGNLLGRKMFTAIENRKLLTTWVVRPASNIESVCPLKGAIVPATASKDLRGTRWSDGAIAWFNCAGNDLQQAAKLTMILSSGFGSGRGFFINQSNLWQAAIVFTVRRLIKPTWLNDRDQFLQPSKPLTDTFKSDCLVWMLFNGSNLSAGADGLEWKNLTWSLTNHFVPFTETEVQAKGRFVSDFMARYIAGLTFSPEARAVLDEGRALWTQFHATDFPRKVRDKYRLGRADVGWYQVRNALEANAENAPADFTPFKSAYGALGDKLRPMVHELGFLAE